MLLVFIGSEVMEIVDEVELVLPVVGFDVENMVDDIVLLVIGSDVVDDVVQ